MKNFVLAAGVASVLAVPAAAATFDPVGTSATFGVSGDFTILPFIFEGDPFDDPTGGLVVVDPNPISPGIGIVERLRQIEVNGTFDGSVENFDPDSVLSYSLGASLSVNPTNSEAFPPIDFSETIITPEFSLSEAYNAVLGFLFDEFGADGIETAIAAISDFIDDAADGATVALPDGGSFYFLWDTTVLDPVELDIAGSFTARYTAPEPVLPDIPVGVDVVSAFDVDPNAITGTYALGLSIEPATVVPVPPALPLLGAGLMGLWWVRRMRKTA